MRTTVSAPYLVDFLTPEVLGLPGRLGLTCAPGKGVGGQHLEDDLAQLRTEHGTALLVTLVVDDELRRLGIGNLIARVKAHGMESAWFPIVDSETPASADELRPVVNLVLERLRDGDTVVLHCKAGLGRAGLVAGCCLVACGVAAQEAIETVRLAREGAIETQEQFEFIVAFADALAEGEDR